MNRTGFYKRIKKSLSILLALLVAVSLLPAGVLSFDAYAANDNIGDAQNVSGVEFKTLTDLGFSVNTDEVASQLTDGKVPASTRPFALKTIPELMVSGIGAETVIYDVTLDNILGGSVYTNADSITSPSTAIALRSSAFDPTGSGKKSHVAQVTVNNGNNYTGKDSSKVDLVVFDGKEFTSIMISLYPFQLKPTNAGAFISVATGDYDGDGKEEIAVYSPDYGIDGIPRVIIYKYDADTKTLLRSGDKTITGAGGLAPDLALGKCNFYDAEMYEFFSVNLATVPAFGDGCDALAIATSYMRDAHKSDARKEANAVNIVNSSYISVWYNPLIDGGRVTVERLTENWSAYNSTDDTRYEIMMFPSVTAGDINNDGVPEIVVAGYRINNPNYRSLNGSELDHDRFLITYCSYDTAKGGFVLQRPFQWVSFKDHQFIELGKGISNGANDDDWVKTPLVMTIFAERGPDVNNSVFVGGYVLALPTLDASRQNASTDEFNMGIYGGYDKGPKEGLTSTNLATTFRIRYAAPLKNYDGSFASTNKAVAEVVSGNFISDPLGREQVIFTYFVKNYGSMGIGSYDAVYCFLNYRGEINGAVNDISVGSTPGDLVGFFSKQPYDNSSLPTLSLASPDMDDDSTMVRYTEIQPDYFFSDPQVICVLQAAPYFKELDYDASPDTTMTKTSGSVESSDHAVTIGAGASIHMDVDIDASLAIGFNVFAIDVSAALTGSAGWQHSTEWIHSTSLTFASGSSDSVVLTMTPYVRYYYEWWSPEDSEWLPMALDVPMTPRTTQISVDTYDKIAEQNDWKTLRDNALRGSVAGDPTTYSSEKPVTWNLYDKGKSQNYAQGGWLTAGKGSGGITQTISHERSSSHGATWGVGISFSSYAKLVAVGIGIEGSIDYTGGYMWGTFNAADYEGTVPNIPDGHSSLYDYEWEFGTYMVDILEDEMDDNTNDWLNITDQDELRKMADDYGYDTLVLGYRVRSVKRPPYIPAPKLLETTSNSVTFTWPELVKGNVEYYEVAQISGDEEYHLKTIPASALVNGLYTFTDAECYPGKTYQYKVRAFGRGVGLATPGYGMWSAPVYGTTATQEAMDVLNNPKNLNLLEGETAEFSVSYKTTPTGTPTYQWQKLQADDWVNIAGETGTKLTMTNVDLSMHGTQVRCITTARVAGDVYTLNSKVAVLSVYTVTGVTVTPAAVEVNKESSQQFYATVNGDNEPPQEHIWSVAGSDGSSSINENGLLTIGAEETAQTLTVMASSIALSTKHDSAVVTITVEKVEAVVLAVTVLPDTATVEKGKSQLFEAIVAIQGDAEQAVDWTVNSSNVFTSIDENGLLTVGPNESAVTLTITATSKSDKTKLGTATVTIENAPPTLKAPSIQTGSLPDGNVGTVYGEGLTADGDETIFWSVTNGKLPTGLILSRTGVISGTPTENAVFIFTVEARNSAGADSKEYTVEIHTIYNIKFNANGGEVSPEFGVTEADAKLGSLPTPTRANYRFEAWFTAESGGDEVTTDTVFVGDTEIFARWIPVRSGQTNIGGPSKNDPENDGSKVEIGDVENGAVEVDNKEPKPGDKVNIDVKPDEGYKVGDVTVKDEEGNELPVTKNEDGGYSFIYGGNKVKIEVRFIPLGDDPAGWNPFIDIKESDWFHDDVKYVWGEGLMLGTSSNTFAPQSSTTRAMVVTILWRLEGEPAPDGNCPFTDVTADWYANAVTWASENGIVEGYGEGLFWPELSITREQLATILYRYADWKGLDISAGKYTSPPFEDVSEISGYAILAMRWAYASGLLKGRTESTIVPDGTATRAELAAILHRFLEN